MKLAAALLACLLPAACSGNADAARAIVTRQLLAQHELVPGTTDGSAARPRFLLVERAAPSQAFVDRFADEEPPLLAGSEETHDLLGNAARPGPAQETLTFWVADFDQTGESHGLAHGGWYGPGVREEYLFELRRDGGEWSVASTTLETPEAPVPEPVQVAESESAPEPAPGAGAASGDEGTSLAPGK